MKDECDEDLAKALPALKRATKALSMLSKDNIREVKALKHPPKGVILTMEAICIMLEVSPERIRNPEGPGKIDSYWKPAQKKLLGDPKFVKRLTGYDGNDIAEEILEAIEPYLKRGDFEVA